MYKNLVIVESPAKAKTIEKFLGGDYKVMSSYGHIRDLKPTAFSIDIDNNYAPEYIIPPDKKKIVAELKKAAAAAEDILLASDEDREGEAISWHLSEVLDLNPLNAKRIVFHEITKAAILEALKNPRDIDMNLVNAQQARRVLDRIVGFEVSPILWRKVKPALSAGRVQSVAVRLIVEREREINKFVAEASYNITATFILPDGTTALNARLNRRFKDKSAAQAFLESCIGQTITIEDVSKKPARKSPAPPFTTSTLQQEAARKLGFSVSQTMRVAQILYEAGHITYMRTDSFNLSDLALDTSKEAIINSFGERYHKLRKYQTKSKGAQEAHEAIRPTYMNVPEVSGSAQEQRLYDLIFKRTIASQMADAELERTTITISVGGRTDPKFVAQGEIITFDGFLHVYLESQDEDAESDEENGLLPPVNVNDILSMKKIIATERFTQRPARYTEASLVRRMEELGIGRPSTYAPTIQTIQNRAYVERGDKDGVERQYNILTLQKDKITDTDKKELTGFDRNKLIPTDTGLVVNDFLTEHFPDILDYNFTANVEKEFDSIAEGELEYSKATDEFYTVFHPTVEAASASRTEHKIGERRIGVDPKSGKPVFVKIGRYGPLVQIGKTDPKNKDVKPQFASLQKNQSIETITLEEALKLFEWPRKVGEFEGAEMTASFGRFGPFIRHNGVFASIPKELDPLTITEEEAIELVLAKRQKEIEKHIKSFDEEPEMKVLNGRYGAYIAFKGNNYKLPNKTIDPKSLSLEDCKKIVEDATAAGGPKTKSTKTKK